MSIIEYYVDSGLAVITMADSDNGNRLNPASLNGLMSALNKAENDDNVRAILLRSNGRNFCLGMDLVFLQNSDGEENVGKNTVVLYTEILLKMYRMPKPVISLIKGSVKAGGTGLAAASDIIIASDDSTFELSEVLLGLIPANVLPFLFSLRMSPQKARYLVLTAKNIGADEAKSYGLVDEVFPQDKLEKGLKSIIRTIFRAAPHALAETKKFTCDIYNKNIDDACSMAKSTLFELIAKDEVIAGISAFNEGDVPKWFDKCRPEKPLVLN